MKASWILGFIFLSTNFTLLDEANQARDAKKFYLSGKLYLKIADEVVDEKDQARWNAAIAFQMADSLDLSARLFQQLSRSSDLSIRSGSMNQMAVYLAENIKLQEALTLCRQALIENPDDELARYNFELIRRKLKMPPPPPPQEQEQEENQKQKQQNDTSKPSAPKPTEHLGSVKDGSTLTYDQARTELDKLDEKEKKFIQQLRKKIKGRPARKGYPEI
jgi:hypothetical protein